MATPGRILCVTSNFPRWAGDSTTPFVLHLAQDLQALGWRVDVLAPHAPACARTESLEGVEVERFRYFWPEGQQTVCYQGGALVNLRNRPLDHLKLPALVAAEWAAIARRLRLNTYDLLHSHWILPQGFSAVLAARGRRIPHVVTAHGGDVFDLGGKLLTGFKRFVVRRADAVTVNSSVTEAAVRELGSTAVVRIPMGISVGAAAGTGPPVAAIREHHRRGSGPLLLFVGRLVEDKGVRDLIDAVGLLRSRLPDVTALVVGEGQDRAALEAHCRAAGLADSVQFQGWVQPSEIPHYMAAADVFLAPSRRGTRGWVEGQGLTILEAMAAGAPVVATRLGGVVDSIEHGHTGLLVDERAPDQLARAVEKLVADRDFAAGLADAARKRVVTQFSRGRSAESFSRLFKQLTGGHKPQADE